MNTNTEPNHTPCTATATTMAYFNKEQKTELIQENLHNLLSLWKTYGAHTVRYPHALHSQQNDDTRVYYNPSWPYRSWVELGTNSTQTEAVITNQILSAPLRALPEAPLRSAVIPVCLPEHSPHLTQAQGLFHNAGFTCSFTQKAMALNLHSLSQHTLEQEFTPLGKNKSQSGSELALTQLTHPQTIPNWCDIAGAAFQYTIDQNVIFPLVNHPHCRLYLAYENQQPVATALLYKTGTSIGIHQIGVHPAHQGKGVANALMKKLLMACKSWGGRTAVLQASTQGEGLYIKWGFEPLFMIHNFTQTC